MSELRDSVTLTDNRNGATLELPLDKQGSFEAAGLKELGLKSFDQPLLQTATARSAITFIDGSAGILRYRGYPIEQLAERCSFEQVAALLWTGELPSQAESAAFSAAIANADVDRAGLARIVAAFPAGSHPMPILLACFAFLAAAHPEARAVNDPLLRRSLLPRLLAEVACAGAGAVRRSAGLAPLAAGEPASGGYAQRFLAQLLGEAHPQLELFGRTLDLLFTLHADHELNAGTNAMRAIGSSQADPYSSLAGAAAALSGPLHGGANEAVLTMLAEIGTASEVPAFLARVEAKEAKLMGFGHRVYKNFDPRATVIKTAVDELLAVTGADPLLEVALELERIALAEPYFIERKLYPNVDFYSGLAYKAMGFQPAAFTVLFALPRCVGWLTHWDEMLSQPGLKIVRPAQIYVGAGERQLPQLG